jgi:adenosylmethionine-8-amino-7-oxononanoate aminotransferase
MMQTHGEVPALENAEGARPDESRLQPLIQPWPLAGSIGKTELGPILAGDGVYVKDALGRSLIDGPAGMWCVNVGHRHAGIADALRDQAMTLTYTSPWYTSNNPARELAQMLGERRRPDLSRRA